MNSNKQTRAPRPVEAPLRTQNIAEGPRAPLNQPPISQPSISKALDNTLEFLDQLETTTWSIRAAVNGEGYEPAKNDLCPRSIEARVANICTRVASLLGEALTLQEQIG